MSVANGVWLAVSLAPWYIGAVLYALFESSREHAPVGVLIFGIVSVISAAAGLTLAISNRSKKLVWILMPLAGSFVFVFISGLFRNKLHDPSLVQIIATVFEAACLIGFVWLMKPNWWTSTTLAIFCGTVWLVAVFMSSMSFTDTWL